MYYVPITVIPGRVAFQNKSMAIDYALDKKTCVLDENNAVVTDYRPLFIFKMGSIENSTPATDEDFTRVADILDI